MSPANIERFAERLRALLVERGLTQTELAARTGIDRVDLNRMANGKREPKPDELAFLAKVLGVEPESLIEGHDTSEIKMYSLWAERVLDAEALVAEIRSQLDHQQAAHRDAEARWSAEREELLAAREKAIVDCAKRSAEREAATAKREGELDRELRVLRDQIATRDGQIIQLNAKVAQQTQALEHLRAETAKQAGRAMFAGLVGAAVGAIISSNSNSDD